MISTEPIWVDCPTDVTESRWCHIHQRAARICGISWWTGLWDSERQYFRTKHARHSGDLAGMRWITRTDSPSAVAQVLTDGNDGSLLNCLALRIRSRRGLRRVRFPLPSRGFGQCGSAAQQRRRTTLRGRIKGLVVASIGSFVSWWTKVLGAAKRDGCGAGLPAKTLASATWRHTTDQGGLRRFRRSS